MSPLGLRPWANNFSIIFTALLCCILLLSIPIAASHHYPGPRNLHKHHAQPRANAEEDLHQHLSSRFIASFVEPDALANTTPAAGQDDFTCGPNKPCSNGACCGESGWCGYGLTYCGKGCQSNCNATADCGEFARQPGAACPLNVCCSEFGFCGTTADFCGKGCQSNCEQPKPSGPATDVQQRVIGYWEAWNSQHLCGTMTVGEIPVNYLTHLNIAFGYISSDFRITNMDGVSSDLYRNVGNLKARNPSLKIVISLGGWAFSDPGPWRAIFPTITSSAANRAIFIQNLLGFLSEYGYDGVDWEYPGADDRGGSDVDAANYVALLKELRAAITSSGHSYIVTFTAPTSYWYLRHFDIKNMSTYVDWINLMSYDLHGVWDSTNPIGSQVLAHTNLTEIDLALDLFWRAEIEPSSIVLGIAFYGRTFNLKSSSCWKPGCPFGGPGDAGQCTGTAGILSYREIQTILDQTGATSYLDKEAAVRYMVYGNNNWVSYDDEITFQAKIDYANKIGLSGLLIWAIDLDDSKLDALRAISGYSGSTGADSAFSLVDLKYLFPSEELPPSDSPTSYGLVTFGSGGDLNDVNPTTGPFGFFLVAGDSHVVSKLKKRSGEPEPFVFLDCPSDVREQPKDKAQSARVICLSEDVEGCFRILERGVEGTIVEMPDNCASNTFARAISLNVSPDQSVPLSIGKRTPTSVVYDFSFDFNLGLMRRDSNNTRFRLDYSNVKGYWDHLVNAPGIQSRDLNRLESRFFAPTTEDWDSVFDKVEFDWSHTDATQIKGDLSAPVFWQSVEDLDQAHGFLKARGQTDLTYGIGGIGDIDISKAGKGNPAISDDNRINLKGHTIDTSASGGIISLNPYYQFTYQMATLNGSNGGDFSSSTAAFNGRLTTRIITDFGDFQANFPPPENPPEGMYNDKRQQNQISIPKDDVLYGSSPNGGQIAIGTSLTLGLNLEFLIFGDLFHWAFDLPKLVYDTMEVFTFSPGSEDHPEFAYIRLPNNSLSDDLADANTDMLIDYENINDHGLESKRGSISPRQMGSIPIDGWGYGSGSAADPNLYFDASQGLSTFQSSKSKFLCVNCDDCYEEDINECCGCISMDYVWDLRDMPPCDPNICEQRAGEWPSTSTNLKREEGDLEVGSEHAISKRDAGEATITPKKAKFCGKDVWANTPYNYPSFPKDDTWPWEGIQQGRWDSISRYWGNSSGLCQSWAVGKIQPADVTYIPKRNGLPGYEATRSSYQTEHVFEGQLIGDFFTYWLDKGRLNDKDKAIYTTPKMACSVTNEYVSKIRNANYFQLPNYAGNLKKASFGQILMSELGSQAHLDRLTIFQSRPNQRKGLVSRVHISKLQFPFKYSCNLKLICALQIFQGNTVVSDNTYKGQTQQEQLLVAKEVGKLSELHQP
ncbi:glycoside hydrolase family 18 protein [Trichoderma virens Gv29-8]|uniref:chitinase n=1 Tax=Hypocrea virens (strain Gv29-8 / FGSC 10586) TaxID=413071 RepID=G9MU59_HYPVG|nr:glycoside hydrolase family 18 protein [Trichoderma virens Gv29-8]EHK22022.1 glycoside hydrolase family 18 protein [Trichoderma virens Gv29-8]